MWKSVIIIFLAFLFTLDAAPEAAVETETVQDAPPYRLPNTTEPVKYELWMTTNIHTGEFAFNGRVSITIRVLTTTQAIHLNSVGLNIYGGNIRDEFGVEKALTATTPYVENQIVVIDVTEVLVAGRTYILTLEFDGHLQSQARGFYYNRYTDDFGRTFYIASTAFQHIFARWAFPCYDEPRFRTPFTIHVTHGSLYRAASNVAVLSEENHEDDMMTTHFHETHFTMSVNLVAFSVTNYVSVSAMSSSNKPMGVLAPVHQIEQVEFGLNRTIEFYEKIERYTAMPLSLLKLDSIVINDFMHITMENWGLMTYDSKYFLHKEGVTTIGQTVDIVKLITHTLMHNYFGNLVGIPWWSYTWMTEGFATYFEYYITDEYFPDLHMSDVFVTLFLQRSLYEDSLLSTRPMSTYSFDNIFDIDSVFDGITLRKGPAIIRMLDNVLGKDTFQLGVRNFLFEMAYSIAEPADLYRNLQSAVNLNGDLPSDLTVAEMMYPWEHLPGYPLVTIMRNYQNNEIVVNQRRFLYQREDNDPECSCWHIPLSFATTYNPDMENTKPSTWLRRGTKELVLRTTENQTWSSEDWVLFNIQQTGFYRVNYDTQNWRLLANELHQGPPFKIGTLNRAQLIDDSFSLAFSDIIEFPLFLDIIKYIREEEEFPVWTTAERHLIALNRRLEGPTYELHFGRFLKYLTSDLFDKLDIFENVGGTESARITFLRPIIVDLACRAGSPKCLTATRILVMAEALTGHRLVPHEKSSVYYCHGLRNANWETYFYFWRRLHSIPDTQERHHLVNSLSCFQSSSSIADLLLTTSIIDSSAEIVYSVLERFMVLATAFRNGHVKVVINFLKENHEDVAKTYTFNYRMEEILREMTGYLHSDEEEADFEDMLTIFFEAGHLSALQIAGIRQEMEHNQRWIDENRESIEQWIHNFFDPTESSSSKNYLSLGLLLFGVLFKFSF
ncbi:aminopeptidase N-like [Phlebotomus argentipes]|uniref:aminopeptidase N-like n=1 Tax=Phlebotomus argentipes TaxID=94469 RepID=UPI002892C88F|nr:aminopeptidase N-like [Phlebotomus argentipes]